MISFYVKTIPSTIQRGNWQTWLFFSFLKCRLLKSALHAFCQTNIPQDSQTLHWRLNEDLITCLDNSHLFKSHFPLTTLL